MLCREIPRPRWAFLKNLERTARMRIASLTTSSRCPSLAGMNKILALLFLPLFAFPCFAQKKVNAMSPIVDDPALPRVSSAERRVGDAC